jgi:hypothetical protein
MNNIIGLKDLRERVDYYAKKIGRGESFVVMRRSRPLFKVSPVVDETWEEVIDFTKIKKGGVDIDSLLSRL